MDRNGIIYSICLSSAFFQGLLAIALLATTGNAAVAQRAGRMVYNPVTGRSEIEQRPRQRPISRPVHREPAQRPIGSQPIIEPAGVDFIEPTSHYCQGDCSNDFCEEEGIGCGEPVCSSSIGSAPCLLQAQFYGGFEATFVQPRFGDNVAFTVMEADGASFESFNDTEFDYDLDFTPRVFLGWKHSDGVGLRATWWQFDHGAATATANPPANGFGAVTHPTFGDIDISTVIPTDSYSATSDLNAYTIDIEATKETSFCGWDLGVSGGVRYARSEQGYQSQLRDTNGVLRGEIDYRHSIEGFGPTISLSASRPLSRQLDLFCKARGSVLFGDGESTLRAVEDADLTTPFNTTRTTSRDDLLSIGEIQLGLRWQATPCRGQAYRPFLSAALEAQVWNGAGNATSEDGTLGFFGFNTGVGVDW